MRDKRLANSPSEKKQALGVKQLQFPLECLDSLVVGLAHIFIDKRCTTLFQWLQVELRHEHLKRSIT